MASKCKHPRVAVFISDLHAGSSVALMPPDFTTLEGQRISQNALQRWLWDCWMDATTVWLPEVLGADPWALGIIGDATEGVHHGTKQVISSDPQDHLSAALHILQPLAERADQVFVVRGTECHTGNMEEALGRVIGAHKFADTGNYSTDKLHLEVHGCPLVAHHHITTTSRTWLEGSGLSINLLNEQAEAFRQGFAPPRVLVTGHRHKYGEFSNGSGTCVVLPPWQGLTRFGYKAVPSALTQPGIVVLDWRDREPGDLPRVRARLYRPPAPARIAL